MTHPGDAGKLRLGVMISGRGSNLQALMNAIASDSNFPARIVRVISNVADAAGLERARLAGIDTTVISHRDYSERRVFDAAVTRQFTDDGVDLVCLAGFMRLLSAEFVDHWRDRLINIHPSLLPAFKGLDVHERVLAAGVRFTGCTVHFVRADMDSGPVLVQAAVPVQGDDTASSLAGRVLKAEHAIYPLAVRLIAQGRVRVEGERALIEGVKSPDQPLINPVIPDDRLVSTT